MMKTAMAIAVITRMTMIREASSRSGEALGEIGIKVPTIMVKTTVTVLRVIGGVRPIGAKTRTAMTSMLLGGGRMAPPLMIRKLRVLVGPIGGVMIVRIK